jgi:aminopeptidase N
MTPFHRAAAMVVALTAGLAMPAHAQRLGGTVVPDHYDLHFTPDLARETFDGEAAVRVRLTAPSDAITLHAVDLDVQQATVTAAGRAQTARVTVDAVTETITLTVPAPIPPGPATIELRYRGALNDRLRGFYISRANGRKYAVTQLEATDARRAFPSFDEPAFKATFALTLTIDEGDTAISNGRLLSDTPGPGANRHTLRFSTSPKMSTYLVAMAVGDFQCLTGGADGVPIRVCATPDKVDLARFALEAAEYTMGWFNQYFSIRYPFEKLDIVAVPDFAAGAMENTGAIFYRERLLTIDEQKVSVDARRNVAAVLAHEIAHHWFGDLVTMRWWDDIWLNEGLATWMESKPLQTWKPTWDADLVEAADTQRALNLDALQSTRAIRTRAETPQQINELFDAIVYEKSAAVLRMVEELVGAEAFRAGVNRYLTRHAYANASAEDFWTEIAAVSGQPVDRILGSFVDQKGSPLVDVRAQCTDERLDVTLTQQPFFLETPPLPGGDADPRWQTPVCLKWPNADGTMGQTCRLLTEPLQTWQTPSCPAWLYANAGGLGVYRTAYEPEMLRRLAAVAGTALTPVERISLAGDQWALVRQDGTRMAQYLSLAEGLAADRAGRVVGEVTGRLDYIAAYLVDEAARPAYEAWIRRVLGPAARELGWTVAPGEPEDQQARRASVLFTLGAAGDDPETIRTAGEIARQYLDGTATPDPATLGVAIQLAASHGDAALYDRMLARMRSEIEPTEQQRFRNALGRFTDPALVRRTIALALSTEVRTQDAPGLLAALLANPAARQDTWQALKNGWTELEQRLGVFLGIPNVVGATGAFCDAAAREDIRRFFDAHRIPSAERALRRSLESIDACVALRDRSAPGLREFLQSAP